MYMIYVTYSVYIYIYKYLFNFCIAYISSHSKGPEQDQLRSPFVPYVRNTAERSIHNFDSAPYIYIYMCVWLIYVTRFHSIRMHLCTHVRVKWRTCLWTVEFTVPKFAQRIQLHGVQHKGPQATILNRTCPIAQVSNLRKEVKSETGWNWCEPSMETLKNFADTTAIICIFFAQLHVSPLFQLFSEAVFLRLRDAKWWWGKACRGM